MTRVLVVAPHPDDETLGCGGTLLRHQKNGDEVHWLIVTSMQEDCGYSSEAIDKRKEEISRVAKAYGFSGIHQLGFSTARLDTIPLANIVDSVSAVFKSVSPAILYLPNRSDAHSDHCITFDAATACAKWFRHPSVNRVLCYETLSETDAGLNQNGDSFRADIFVDISEHLDRKIEIMGFYDGEMGSFPFPRSLESMEALAKYRGTMSGFKAAEAFSLLRERIS